MREDQPALLLALVLVLGLVCHRAESQVAPPAGVDRTRLDAPAAIWIPPQATTWQWQLTGTLDQTVDAAMYDIDLFDNPAPVVAALHANGRNVVCYFSAGTWEDWRPDAGQFPVSLRGRPVSGWAGERWLDIRRLDVLRPLMEARLDLCRQKGFDAVEPDNIDGYANESGFLLSADDQLRYNVWLAAAAHVRGLSIGLKNDLDQARALVGPFDWALVEQCFEYNECQLLAPFTAAGKAVFEVEYNRAPSGFCEQAMVLKFNAMRKNVNLDAFRAPCRP